MIEKTIRSCRVVMDFKASDVVPPITIPPNTLKGVQYCTSKHPLVYSLSSWTPTIFFSFIFSSF